MTDILIYYQVVVLRVAVVKNDSARDRENKWFKPIAVLGMCPMKMI